MPELIDLITANFDYDNFFSAQLTAPMTASDTDIFLDAVPTPSEGVLVIDWDVAASREVIFYNSKTASKVTCPSVGDGRGFDDSTATTHLSGANVIMAPVRAWFRLAQQLATTSTAAWKPLGYTPNTIVDNGNRSYTMVFNSVDLTSFISNGMRLKGTPTTAQPTQCADLESGSSQYFNKTTPAGMTWTDDFCAGGWVKPESHTATSTIISRANGTQGWIFDLDSFHRVTLRGFNAALGNFKGVQSYTSIPLARWSHVAAQLDMNTATTTPTTNYVMIDGLSAPCAIIQGGTNPTALVQAGDLQVGAYNGATNLMDGKLAQVWVSSAKITQANIQLIKNQGITSAHCATYNIASAFSLSNSVTDINTTNANNLTAQGGALTTATDSPFGLDGAGVPGTNEWGVVMSATFATNTTVVVQAPEGSTWPTLPTSSMISSMSYSTEKVPFGFPDDANRWKIIHYIKASVSASGVVAGTTYNPGGIGITVPIGAWNVGYNIAAGITPNASIADVYTGLQSSSSAFVDGETELTSRNITHGAASSNFALYCAVNSKRFNLTAALTLYALIRSANTPSSIQIRGNNSTTIPECSYFYAECDYV